MNILRSRHQRQLLEACAALARAKSVNEYTDQIVRFVKDLGFRTVSATVVIEHSMGLAEFQCAHNTPQAYQNSFFSLDLAARDPVCKHCKTKNTPLIWDQDTYVQSHQGDLWEHQAYFGYKTGIAIGMHFPNGKHFMFAADGDFLPSSQPKTMKSVIADYKTFAMFAQAAAFELSRPSWPENISSRSLTGKEIESLRLTMDGKTSREVADIMNLSDRDAQILMARAKWKLRCNTKYEAVLKAIRSGILECQ